MHGRIPLRPPSFFSGSKTQLLPPPSPRVLLGTWSVRGTWQTCTRRRPCKLWLSAGEPPSQSDEVVLRESQLHEVDEVVAAIDEPNTQKSKRRKRATQDESSLKKRAKKLKTIEDDPPASPDAGMIPLQLLVHFLLYLGRLFRPFFHLLSVLTVVS